MHGDSQNYLRSPCRLVTHLPTHALYLSTGTYNLLAEYMHFCTRTYIFELEYIFVLEYIFLFWNLEFCTGRKLHICTGIYIVVLPLWATVVSGPNCPI